MTVRSSGGTLGATARSLLYLACFLSGASALVYEVVWTRVLARQLGHATASVATVLSVFMGGLALGAWLATRWLPRLRSATRAYALVEIGILLLPWLGIDASLWVAAGGNLASAVLASALGPLAAVPVATHRGAPV